MATKILLPVRPNVKLSIADESSRRSVGILGSRSRDVGKSSRSTRIPRSTIGGRDVAELADLVHDVDLDGYGSEDSMSAKNEWKREVSRKSKRGAGDEREEADFFHESARIRCCKTTKANRNQQEKRAAVY